MKIEMWKTEKLVPYENNPRINDDAVDAVAMSLSQYGWQQPIVVDTKGVIIVGHTRWKAALLLNLDVCPVCVAKGLTDEQTKAYRIADNKTGEVAEWDADMLRVELSDLADMDFDLELTGFTVDELDGWIFGVDEPPKAEEDPEGPEDPEDPGLPVKHRAINKTRSASFLSLRRWGAAHKKAQIQMIQAKKIEPDPEFVAMVADEVTDLLISTFQSLAGFFVSNIPPGNSRGKYHLATEIAKAVASRLELKHVPVFEDYETKTKYVGDLKRKTALKVLNDGILKVILIDDVATTGTSIEAALKALSTSFVIPVVWIYGESREEEE